MYATEWFISLFTRSQSLHPQLRIQCIDTFFLHSWHAIYALALAIFRFTEDALIAAVETADEGEELEEMKAILLKFSDYIPEDGRALFSSDGAAYYLMRLPRTNVEKMEMKEREQFIST